jgi:hypothetical protein
MRAVLLCAALAALGGCTDVVINVCNVDQQVDTATAGTTVTDCGQFYRGSANYTDEAMVAAQLCVLNALAGKRGFRLVYDADPTKGPIEPGLRAGWVGIATQVPIESIDASEVDGGPAMITIVQVRTYAGRGGGDMASKDDLVSVLPCDSVDAPQGCNPVVGTPCLTCTTVELGSVQCRG